MAGTRESHYGKCFCFSIESTQMSSGSFYTRKRRVVVWRAVVGDLHRLPAAALYTAHRLTSRF